MSDYWFIPLIVESILLMLLIAYDNGIAATFTLVVAALVIHFGGFIDLVELVSDNAVGLMSCAAVYLITGIAWSLVKWTLYLLKDRRKYIEDRDKFKAGLVNKTDAEKELEWKRSFRGSHIIPQVRDHKDDIMRWMFYWPFSMTGTIVKDFTKKVYTVVYNSIKDAFQGIANKIYEDLDK